MPRSPICWLGGKGRMVKKLLSLIPPHDHYVEPFGGGASLLFAKPPCGGVETYNDIDSGLYNFFRVIADPKKFTEFKRHVEALPHSRELYDLCMHTWEEIEDEVERAAMWFVVARQSFSGRFGSGWGTVVTSATSNCAETCGSWRSTIDCLPVVHERLRQVQIEHMDWRVILGRYCGEGYLAYCDPPYVLETRKKTRYKHEMSDEDHRELVQTLLSYDGAVMLSGYENEIYGALTGAGWDRQDFKTSCHAAGRTRDTNLQGLGAATEHQSRIESVWRNPEAIERIEATNLPLFSTECGE